MGRVYYNYIGGSYLPKPEEVRYLPVSSDGLMAWVITY